MTYSPERYVVGALPKSSGPQIARIIESNGPKAPDVGSRSSGFDPDKVEASILEAQAMRKTPLQPIAEESRSQGENGLGVV